MTAPQQTAYSHINPTQRSYLHGGAPPRTRPATSILARVISLVTSPSLAFALSMIGYYVLATYTNKLLPEGSLGGILIRAGTLCVVIIAHWRWARPKLSVRPIFIMPLVIFMGIYMFRISDNLSGNLYFPIDNRTLFLILGVSTLIPALALSRIQGGLRDDQTVVVFSLLCMTFIGGMALNLDVLLSPDASARLSLDKVNPIGMAETAFAFILYYIVAFSHSRRVMVEAIILLPILALVVLYSGSRGALLAGSFAIVIYIILLRGSQRLLMILGLGFSISTCLAIFGKHHLDFMLRRLQGLSDGRDISARSHFEAWQGAWQQFLDDPLFGRYAIELSKGTYPHNIYLESLMAVGLLGSIPFIIHIGLALRASVGIVRSRQFGISATLGAIIFFRELIAHAGKSSLWGATGFWIASTLVIAIWYGRNHVWTTFEARHFGQRKASL